MCPVFLSSTLCHLAFFPYLISYMHVFHLLSILLEHYLSCFISVLLFSQILMSPISSLHFFKSVLPVPLRFHCLPYVYCFFRFLIDVLFSCPFGNDVNSSIHLKLQVNERNAFTKSQRLLQFSCKYHKVVARSTIVLCNSFFIRANNLDPNEVEVLYHLALNHALSRQVSEFECFDSYHFKLILNCKSHF